MRQNRNLARIGLSVLMAGLSVGAFAETKTLSTLDDIADWAQANNLSYQQAVLTERTAQLAIPDVILAKSSTVATTYSNSSTSTASSTSTSSGFTVKTTIPVVDQLSVATSISQDNSGSVTATINPLAHADTRTQARITWQKDVAAVDEAECTASSTAIKAALSWMSAARILETKQKAVKVTEDTYEATRKSNAIDPKTITMDDLLTALKDLSTARADLVTAQAAELKAQGALYTALGSARSEVVVVRLDTGALAAALDALGSSLAEAMNTGIAESYSVKVAALDVQSGKSALDALWLYEPSLAISEGVSFAADGTATPKASVTLTLSPDYFNLADRTTAKTKLALSQKTLMQQQIADQNSYDQAVAAVTAAQSTTAGSRVALQQAQDLAVVAAFNVKSGDGSALENDSADLSVAEAEDTLYQSMVSEYSAWLDLAALAHKI